MKNLLGLCFFLSAALSYLKFDQTRRPRHYIIAVFFFLCAILSKSVTLCFAFVPMLYKWWKDGSLDRASVRLSAPFFALGVMSALNTVFIETFKVGAKGAEFTLTFWERIILSGRVFWFYLYKLCVPLKFMFFYPRWNVDAAEWWQWIFTPLALALLAALFLLQKKIGRGAFTLLAFYAISLFPALGFINVYPMIFSFVADHFSYVSVPAALLFLWGGLIFLSDVIRKRSKAADILSRNRPLVLAVAAVPVIFLCIKTAGVTRNYKDEITLWTNLIQRNPGCLASYINLGRQYEMLSEPEKAVPLYKKAIDIAPNDFFAYYGLGNAYRTLGRSDEAIPLYEEALRLESRFPDIHNNLGMAYSSVGRYKDAVIQFSGALNIDANYSKAVINIINAAGESRKRSSGPGERIGALMSRLAKEQGKAQKYDEAILLLNEAVECDPGNPGSFNDLGYAYFRKGNFIYARENFEKALQLDPEHRMAKANLDYVNRVDPENREGAGEAREDEDSDTAAAARSLNAKGVELGKSGDLEGAIALFKRAVHFDPEYAETYNNLGFAYYKIGDHKNAALSFKKAVDIDPGHERARMNLLHVQGVLEQKKEAR
ncbi:tetratricopeptide repeat protein, partial [Candidatus Omnitrophota bacterium]